MRVSRLQAEENREKVIDVASRLFRERGLDGIGVSDLMQAAGLTHGGFYKQFASKEDLAVQACERAMRHALGRWDKAITSKPDDPLGALIAFYLSPGSRDESGDGCPVVALAADAWRHGPEVKATFESGINGHLDRLSEHLPVIDGEDERARSMVVLSTMVGALLLSRTVNDAGLSKAFLQAAKKSIESAIADA